MTFPLAVVDAVKQASALAGRPFLVGYRISPEELENPGITMDDTLQFVEVLSTKKLDYLHVSVMDFWAGSIRDKDDLTSRAQLIAAKVGQKVPIIGVGGIHTPEDAEKALETGVDLVAMGRELLMEPLWLKKVKEDAVDQIATALDTNAQDHLKIPAPLWHGLISRTGWIPLKK
jgi:2,4-dienoyl-CoA reductase-like NADH-dependent reductase (Old Yellow Enzyme family)